MAKQGSEPDFEIEKILDSIAAGRLVVRRAKSEMKAAKVIANLEMSRYRTVMEWCKEIGEPEILQACTEYFSMVAIAALLTRRYDEARELARVAACLPWPSESDKAYFSRRRKELFLV